MAYVRTEKGRDDLYTKLKAAEFLGMTYSCFRYALTVGDIEQGDIQSGQRRYYSLEQLKCMKAALEYDARKKAEKQLTTNQKGKK